MLQINSFCFKLSYGRGALLGGRGCLGPATARGLCFGGSGGACSGGCRCCTGGGCKSAPCWRTALVLGETISLWVRARACARYFRVCIRARVCRGATAPAAARSTRARRARRRPPQAPPAPRRASGRLCRQDRMLRGACHSICLSRDLAGLFFPLLSSCYGCAISGQSFTCQCNNVYGSPVQTSAG